MAEILSTFAYVSTTPNEPFMSAVFETEVALKVSFADDFNTSLKLSFLIEFEVLGRKLQHGYDCLHHLSS